MTRENTMNSPTIAALVYGPEANAASVLAEVVRIFRERGVALGGAIQHNDGPCSMVLEILPAGTRVPISQNLGSGATGCKLDTCALTEAAFLIRRSIDAAPQLALFNKFGGQEAAGRGLCDEMAAAVLSGVPVLTAVSEHLLPEWSAFTGGAHVPLACKPEAAVAWWDTR